MLAAVLIVSSYALKVSFNISACSFTFFVGKRSACIKSLGELQQSIFFFVGELLLQLFTEAISVIITID